MSKSYIPEGFATVTPYLTVNGAVGLIQFAIDVFEAEVISQEQGTDGRIVNAVIRIGDSRLELSDAHEQWGPTPCALHVYVKDTDRVYERALAAGGQSLYEPADMTYGERSGGVRDPFGNNWYIATYTGA